MAERWNKHEFEPQVQGKQEHAFGHQGMGTVQFLFPGWSQARGPYASLTCTQQHEFASRQKKASFPTGVIA